MTSNSSLHKAAQAQQDEFCANCACLLGLTGGWHLGYCGDCLLRSDSGLDGACVRGLLKLVRFWDAQDGRNLEL